MARAIDADEFMKRLILDTSKGFYGEYMDGSDTAYTFREIDRFVDEMPTLTPPNESERAGLYGKYTVYKNKDGSLVTDCFILRPAKDPAAVVALRAYAATTDNAELAADIINWVGAEPNVPLTLEQLRKMDGEPAWWDDGYGSCWGIISVDSAGMWGGIPFFRGRWREVNFEYNIEERKMKIYRRPPEGKEARQ